MHRVRRFSSFYSSVIKFLQFSSYPVAAHAIWSVYHGYCWRCVLLLVIWFVLMVYCYFNGNFEIWHGHNRGCTISDSTRNTFLPKSNCNVNSARWKQKEKFHKNTDVYNIYISEYLQLGVFQLARKKLLLLWLMTISLCTLMTLPFKRTCTFCTLVHC